MNPGGTASICWPMRRDMRARSAGMHTWQLRTGAFCLAQSPGSLRGQETHTGHTLHGQGCRLRIRHGSAPPVFCSEGMCPVCVSTSDNEDGTAKCFPGIAACCMSMQAVSWELSQTMLCCTLVGAGVQSQRRKTGLSTSGALGSHVAEHHLRREPMLMQHAGGAAADGHLRLSTH